MPRIDSITPVQYDGLWPYNSQYDNLPLKYILARQALINAAVDNAEDILDDAKGTAGTLSNRLNQSIDAAGDLLAAAIDEANHNIAFHEDGSDGSTDYVRMKADERAKLENISDNATALALQFETISQTYLFDDATLVFENSPTITWSNISLNTVTANFAFPADAAHQHYYDLVPVADNLMSPDYINYKSTSMATPYVDGSLRVYLNGFRLSENYNIFVYDASTGPSGDWFATSYTSDAANGTFALSRAIDPSDVLTIDFDQSLV